MRSAETGKYAEVMREMPKCAEIMCGKCDCPETRGNMQGKYGPHNPPPLDVMVITNKTRAVISTRAA